MVNDMEWFTKAELKLAKQNASKEKYSNIKIRPVAITDEWDKITNIAIAVLYKLRETKNNTETLNWLQTNCNIDTTYVPSMKIGQRVLVVKKYLEQGN